MLSNFHKKIFILSIIIFEICIILFLIQEIILLDYLTIIGIFGQFLLLIAFIMNSTGKLKRNNNIYYLLNATGGIIFAYYVVELSLNLSGSVNLSSLLFIALGGIWGFFALFMLIKNILKKRKSSIVLPIIFTIILISYYLILYTITGNFLDSIFNIPRYPIQFSKNSNDSKLLTELIPNSEQLFEGSSIKLPRVIHIKINSDGFRDREFSIEKPNNTFRIIVLGDSFTFGWGVELNETYSKVLEKKLNSLNNGINYEVLNFGVPAYNTMQEVEMFKVKGIKYNPDMIIIGYLFDDIEDSYERNKIGDDMLNVEFGKNAIINMRDPLTFDKVNKIWDKAINTVREESLTNPFEEVWKNVEIPLQDLSNITSNRNNTVLIVTFLTLPNNDTYTYEKFKNPLREIANKNGWYLVDTEKIFTSYSRDTLWITGESHPTPFAYELVGEQIYNYLIENKLVPTTSKSFEK